jgi:tetratricopeptide (TPR) repeat protein
VRARLLPALILLAACSVHRPPSIGIAAGPKQTQLDLWRPGAQAQKVYVEADLGDGVPRLFMVDTGAAVSVLTREVADALALKTVQQPGRLVGLSGSVRWSQATAPELSLGPMRLANVRFAVDVEGVPSHAGLVPVAGILGNNIWGRFEVVIDYPANQMVLAVPGTLPFPDTAKPLHFDGQHIRTAVVLTVGEGEDALNQPLVLEVDTGARDVILNGRVGSALAERASEGVEPIFGVGAGEDLPASNFLRQTRRVPLTGVEIGGVNVDESSTARWLGYDRAGGGPMLGALGMSGLVGHAVLDGYRVMLDYKGQRIALVPSEGHPADHDIHDWALSHLKRPRRGEDVSDRARLLAFLERRDEALALLRRWQAEHPDDHHAVILESRILRIEGAHAEALDVLMALSPAVLVDEGEIVAASNGLWLAGDLEAAQELARHAVEARPDSPAAQIALADTHRAAGNTSQARLALQEANRLTDNPDGHLIRRAWVAALEGDAYGAITHIRRLMELYPSGGVAPWLYARQVAGTADQALFRRDAERALARLHPGDGPLDFLAAAYRVLGDVERAHAFGEAGRARDCSRAAEAHARSNCEAWYRALSGQELELARADIEAAVAADPNRSEFLDTLAVVLEAQGDVPAARDAAFRAASLVPDDVYLLWQAARLDAAARPEG